MISTESVKRAADQLRAYVGPEGRIRVGAGTPAAPNVEPAGGIVPGATVGNGLNLGVGALSGLGGAQPGSQLIRNVGMGGVGAGDASTEEESPVKAEKTSACKRLFSAWIKNAKDLSTKGRKQVKKKNFALPSKAEGKEEKAESGNYPIHDIEHARNALARVSQHGTAEEKKKVRAKVYAKYPSLKKGKKKSN